MNKISKELMQKINNKFREVLDSFGPTLPWTNNNFLRSIDARVDSPENFPPLGGIMNVTHEMILARAERLNLKLTGKAITALVVLSKGNPGNVTLYLTYIRDVLSGTVIGMDLPERMRETIPNLREIVAQYNENSGIKIHVGLLPVGYNAMKDALDGKYFADEDLSKFWQAQKWYPTEKKFVRFGGNLFDIVAYPTNFVRWGDILGGATSEMQKKLSTTKRGHSGTR